MKTYITLLFITFSISYANISGVAYFEFEDSFSLSRTYFTYKTDISDELSFKLQTDVGRLDTGVDDDRWTVYLKKAHLDWKVNSDMKISMGMIGMNMFNVQEKTWGNRFLKKSAMDEYKFSASADLGFAITQKLGPVTASVLMSNGEGYKESDVDDENKISVQFVMGEKKLNKQDGYNLGLVYSTLEDVTVTGFFGGWAGNGLRIGIENNSEDDDGITNDLTSIYANYKINDSLSAFVRMDDVERNNDGNSEEETMVGLIWTPTKGLDISPNITITDEETGLAADDPIETCKLNFQFKF